MQTRRYHCYTNSTLLFEEVAKRLVKLANKSIAEHGHFRIVLAGGNTPRAIYQLLVQAETDWSAWEVFFGDERCLPVGDVQRNDTMARAAWLDHVPVPRERIFTMPAELGAAEGARRYAQMLAGISGFQLVLLGLGEDGHTASLFPGHAHPPDARAVAVFDAPKLPPERISMSAAMLGSSDHVWFLVSGTGKRPVLNKWLQGDQLPASQVKPLAGVDIFTDINLG